MRGFARIKSRQVVWPGHSRTLPGNTAGISAGAVFYGISPDGTTAYARGSSTNSERHKLYKSTDLQNWTLVYTFPAGTDMINGMIVTPAGTLLVCTCNADAIVASTTDNGKLWRSDDGGQTFTQVDTFVKGGANYWNWAANDDYILAGSYGFKGADTPRDVLISTDDGATWTSCFHVHADADCHIHMVAIDPDGRAWIGVGDSGSHLGLWRYPTAGAPLTVSEAADDTGLFAKVYSAGDARPINLTFREDASGKKYAYAGEDFKENASITRIRYDAITYTAEDSDPPGTLTIILPEGHEFQNLDVVRPYNTGGAPPTGLTVNTDYYIRNLDGLQCNLSATAGGALISYTDAGSGTNTFNYCQRTVADYTAAPQKFKVSGGCGIVRDNLWMMTFLADTDALTGLLWSFDGGEHWVPVWGLPGQAAPIQPRSHVTGLITGGGRVFQLPRYKRVGR